MWNTRNDSLVCAICGPLDGVVVPLGGEFDGAGEGPEAHPGCRCWLTPRMLGDTETRADIDAIYGLERMPGIGAPSVARTTSIPIMNAEKASDDMIGAINNEMGGLEEDFPELTEWVQEVEITDRRTAEQLAEYDIDDQKIRIRADYAKLSKAEWDNILHAGADSDFFVGGQHMENTIIHEAGHALDTNLVARFRADKDYQDIVWDERKGLERTLGRVSGYGDKNTSEWMAERFVYERINGPGELTEYFRRHLTELRRRGWADIPWSEVPRAG